jgi:hypothetical protein
MASKISSWAVALVCLAVLQGCVGYPKDRPYDPNFDRGEQLIDQIPNWEGEALRKRACSVPKQDRYSWMRNVDCGD